MDGCTLNTFVASAMQLMMQRLDRMSAPPEREKYYEMRVRQAIAELERPGIVLTDAVDDLMLVVDLAAWNHSNRDKPGGMPDWLRKKIRGRWINNARQTRHTAGLAAGQDPGEVDQ